MKKWVSGLVLLSSVVVLGACTSGSGNSTSESSEAAASKDASIEIEEGSYVIPEGKTPKEEEGYLALSVTIKNNTEDKMSISPDDIALYDQDDNKISSEMVYDSKNKFKTLDYSTLSGGKTLTGYVVFEVERDAEYELHYQPVLNDYSEDLDEIEMKIDAADYQDISEEISNLVQGYTETVFMGMAADGKTSDSESAEEQKETKTSDKKARKSAAKKAKLSLENDLDEERENFDDAFFKAFKKEFSYYEPSDEELNKAIAAYQTANQEKANVTYTVEEMFPNSAIVAVNPETIHIEDVDMDAIINDFVEKNRDTYDTYDYEVIYGDAEKYLLEQMGSKFSETDISEPEYMSGNGFQILLTRKDDQWEIDSSNSNSNYQFKSIKEAFMGDLYLP